MFFVPLSVRIIFVTFLTLFKQSMKCDAINLGLLFVEPTLSQSILRLKFIYAPVDMFMSRS